MAKPALANITTSQTFQNWFDKTNELVNLFKADAITASGGGDTTTGNATLAGTFTATNVAVNTLFSTDALASRTSGTTMQFSSPIRITGATNPVVATFNYGASGGRTRYTDGTTAWDVGMENSAQANFIINTGVGTVKFKLTPAGSLTLTGELLVAGDITTEYSTSDIKLKENLKLIEGALDKVSQINGYTFNYINDEQKNKVVGLIAQEVEKVLPEVVYEFERDGGDKAKAIRYGNVVALLVEAVKELKQKVDELEKNKCTCNCDK